ncbi:hypothetical protein bcgnr5372_38560 [Bacillus luti]
MNTSKKAVKALITISLSTSLLVACSDKEEKVTTTTSQNKSSQTQQKEQPPVQKEVLKQVKNLKHVGGESVESKFANNDTTSQVAARNGYVYYMYSDTEKTYVSIADTKKDKWVVKDKLVHQPGADAAIYGTAFMVENTMYFIDEKGEVKKQVKLPKVNTGLMSDEKEGFIRTNKGDAAYVTTKDMLKLFFEDGTEKEIPMTDYFSTSSMGDFIDLDKNKAYINDDRYYTMYDLKKGKWVYDENGKQVKNEKNNSDTVIPFHDYIVKVYGENNQNRFVYLDEKFKPKQIPEQDFDIVDYKGLGHFIVEKDTLVYVHMVEFEGKKSVQYMEFKESK